MLRIITCSYSCSYRLSFMILASYLKCIDFHAGGYIYSLYYSAWTDQRLPPVLATNRLLRG